MSILDYAIPHLDGYAVFVVMYFIARTTGPLTPRGVLGAGLGWLIGDVIRIALHGLR